MSKIDESKSESEGGASEVQHDQRKPPPSQGFYTKVRTRDAHPSTSPPSKPHYTALFSEVWQKIASQGLLLQGVWVKVGGWEAGRWGRVMVMQSLLMILSIVIPSWFKAVIPRDTFYPSGYFCSCQGVCGDIVKKKRERENLIKKTNKQNILLVGWRGNWVHGTGLWGYVLSMGTTDLRGVRKNGIYALT